MPNKKSYYQTANLRKRIKRRLLKHPEGTEEEYYSIEYCKDCPTLDELKEALAESKQSTRGILKLVALVDNLSAFLSPRYELDEANYSKRTPGIRQYLEQDLFLKSKYKTIMRYKKLATLIRTKSGISIEANLLWGLVESFPTDETDELFWHEDEWQSLHSLYASLEGLNFTQIINQLKD